MLLIVRGVGWWVGVLVFFCGWLWRPGEAKELAWRGSLHFGLGPPGLKKKGRQTDATDGEKTEILDLDARARALCMQGKHGETGSGTHAHAALNRGGPAGPYRQPRGS